MTTKAASAEDRLPGEAHGEAIAHATLAEVRALGGRVEQLARLVDQLKADLASMASRGTGSTEFDPVQYDLPTWKAAYREHLSQARERESSRFAHFEISPDLTVSEREAMRTAHSSLLKELDEAERALGSVDSVAALSDWVVTHNRLPLREIGARISERQRRPNSDG